MPCSGCGAVLRTIVKMKFITVTHALKTLKVVIIIFFIWSRCVLLFFVSLKDTVLIEFLSNLAIKFYPKRVAWA